MRALTDQAYLRELLARHGFRFSKAMGQNFLINPSVCPRMAAASGAGDPDCAGVLEIGPGVGTLTRELSKTARKVVAVELDRRLFPVLGETLSGLDNVELVEGDILQLDLKALLAERFDGPAVVCANLPYYITSPVILRLLEEGLPLRAVTVMVQKEAAQRLCAPPGDRACGAVSASVWYHAQPERLFPVGRGSFLPPPNVDSAVIRLALREAPPVPVRDEERFFQLIRGAFSQRRKTAANAIASAGLAPKGQVEQALAGLGLPPAARAERLTLEQWAGLANALEKE